MGWGPRRMEPDLLQQEEGFHQVLGFLRVTGPLRVVQPVLRLSRRLLVRGGLPYRLTDGLPGPWNSRDLQEGDGSLWYRSSLTDSRLSADPDRRVLRGSRTTDPFGSPV